MRARSFIVRGRGNLESFSSCSHGVGRAISRGEAKRRSTIDGVIDKTPAAYKSIDAVINAQTDWVDMVGTSRQVVCVKG
jgi:tRNA-splicing ligase RtcB